MWCINIDGASRGNPGVSGAGIVIRKNDKIVFKGGYSIGQLTNNQAEYWALVIALAIFYNDYYINDIKPLLIKSDSQLLVNQINKIFTVKNQDLIKLFNLANGFLVKISDYKVVHVYRENNTTADKLANEGIDNKIKVPDYVKKYILKP